MKLSTRLAQVVSEHDLLKHPFYQAWALGQLSLDTLRRYAGQYFAQVESFPRFVSAVHSRCPDIEARKVLLRNLVDEELHGADHPELWLRFAEGLGVSRAEVREEAPLPETAQLLECYFSLVEGRWTEGLCALYAYESQVPAVAASKIDGLKRFYGIEDPRTLAFFSEHLAYDLEHAKQVAELVDAYAEPRTAEVATRRAATALWGFLDGMGREAGISC